MSDSIKVILKQKSIPGFVDFCLDEKIEFNVRPQTFPDTDWEFNLMVKDIKTAVLTGMFLRENRIDISDGELQPKSKKSGTNRKAKEAEEEDKEEDKNQPEVSEDPTPEEPDPKGLF
ncbi:MAG: hypothetical protein LLG13_03540 [Bacteroidales bacterium]|nr:hypothetical protein [Bacteroidales bacterium]